VNRGSIENAADKYTALHVALFFMAPLSCAIIDLSVEICENKRHDPIGTISNHRASNYVVGESLLFL
jgi:hypothetical protein